MQNTFLHKSQFSGYTAVYNAFLVHEMKNRVNTAMTDFKYFAYSRAVRILQGAQFPLIRADGFQTIEQKWLAVSINQVQQYMFTELMAFTIQRVESPIKFNPHFMHAKFK